MRKFPSLQILVGAASGSPSLHGTGSHSGLGRFKESSPPESGQGIILEKREVLEVI